MDINRVVERGIELCHRVAPAELNGQRLRIIPQTHLPPLLGGETSRRASICSTSKRRKR